jgi:asparagine synthase (glutamine-hydrolysing)
MCGISLVTDNSNFGELVHRGPDQTKSEVFEDKHLNFHRLAINDLSDNGGQPFVHIDTTNHPHRVTKYGFVCNGEIYNHASLRNYFKFDEMSGDSDCEVVFRMLLESSFGWVDNEIEVCKNLDGVFSFIFIEQNVTRNDKKSEEDPSLFKFTRDIVTNTIVARDPIGIRPLYYATNKKSEFEFCSEIKGFSSDCTDIKHFPPGFVWTSKHGFKSYQPLTFPKEPKLDYDVAKIHTLLVRAVEKRLMSDRPVGFFLSGGLDSSIIASIGAKLMYPERIHTFSVGVKGSRSPDLIAAKKVSQYLNSIHNVLEFDVKDALKAIPKTIWHLESYDCTTCRASVPMYLLSKYVSDNFEHKVILSGEGADELFGGYLYFHDAPDDEQFQSESIRLIQHVHQFDALRADRCTAGNGLELRVPFFDKTFVEYITNIKTGFKRNNKNWMEKQILRKSFEGMLPNEILYRQKNGMSDAVGYSWVDCVKTHVEQLYSDTDVKDSHYDKNKPMSKEELYYRNIYHTYFDKHDAVGSIWRPLWTTELDPSARKLRQFVDLHGSDE